MCSIRPGTCEQPRAWSNTANEPSNARETARWKAIGATMVGPPRDLQTCIRPLGQPKGRPTKTLLAQRPRANIRQFQAKQRVPSRLRPNSNEPDSPAQYRRETRGRYVRHRTARPQVLAITTTHPSSERGCRVALDAVACSVALPSESTPHVGQPLSFGSRNPIRRSRRHFDRSRSASRRRSVGASRPPRARYDRSRRWRRPIGFLHRVRSCDVPLKACQSA
jgi:hypothetical protein